MEYCAILIPCYNEEKTIRKVVRDWKKEIPEATIYVYDNNSTDNTAKIAKEEGAVVRREYKQGKGNVIRRMFREIDAQCYIMIDGDDTYPVEYGRQMMQEVLEKKTDMVVGDRLSSTYFENVTVRDIKNFIIENIDEKEFLPFMQNINALHQVTESRSEDNMEDLWDDMENDDFEEIIDVILGIREDVKMYSRSVVRYLYQFLQKHKEVKYSDLLEVLKRAAERELNDPDEQYPDRLISFSKLKQELERL